MKQSVDIGLDDRVIERIQDVFRRHNTIERVMLYGSRAKGSWKPGSDIDITLMGSSLNADVLNAVYNELDDLNLPWTFNISLFSSIENENLVAHIERVGLPLYEAVLHE